MLRRDVYCISVQDTMQAMSMRNYNPFTGYVTLLWCRDCGHLASKPRADGRETIQHLLAHASCSRCKSRNIGARLTYELGLPGPGSFYIWELKMIASALSEAGQRAQHAAAAIPHGERSEERQRHDQTAGIYYRLAGIYQSETHSREALPMHVLPRGSKTA